MNALIRRVLALAAVLVGLAAIGIGGSLLPVREASPATTRTPLVGRTTTVCTAGPAPSGSQSTTGVDAVAVGDGSKRSGKLSAAGLKGSALDLTVSVQGKGGQLPGITDPVVLSADGAMASASSAVVYGASTQGGEASLVAAPCVMPATSQWFSGLGATDTDRTELVLTNPDDTQAEVDLRFYGRNGRVVVPGSPGLVIQANSSRSVSLTSLVKVDGPLGMSIHASQGRVAAVAKRTHTADLKPAGVDWQVPSTTPSLTTVIPAVPEDAGARQLVVTNPGAERATVTVQVLGLEGAYAPSGAERLEVPAESAASVDLAAGLAGEGGSVKLTSDHPVTAAVVSASSRTDATADLAVQSSTPVLVKRGVSALATSNDASAELILSNAGDQDTQVSFEVRSYDGVTLRTDEVLLAPASTATRRLNSPAPSYLVVSVPTGSAVVGGIVFTQGDGAAAGLATIPLTSPDVAGRAPRTTMDPSVGR